MTDQELSHLFGLFRTTILEDTTSLGYPSSVIGACLNWYSPDNPEYLDHVDLWKQLLARGAGYPDDVPAALIQYGLVKRSPYGSVYINDEDVKTLRQVHAIVNLFYKSHCSARRATDWDSVKSRLSNPPELSLTKKDVRRLRAVLRPLDVLPPLEGFGSYGPGITAEGFSPYDRWMRSGRIPPVPPNWYRWNARDEIELSVADDFRITRIAEVPKTLKSNRVISSEPAQSMFAQKVVWRHLDMLFEKYYGKYVSLHDQERHNTLLDDPDYRSVDLSDASDYVSCDLVSLVLPTLWPLLASVRSTHSLFPDGSLVQLRTFAPMGSGVCFPVLTAINLAIGLVVCKHPFSIYGDDGIFHKDDIIRVTEMQIACGLKVNQGKTCYLGTFRESCGKELYGRTDITPVYIRESLKSTDWSKLNELVEKFNSLGWYSTARLAASFATYYKPLRYRWNPRLQRIEVLAPIYIRVDRDKALDGYAGLRKWILTRVPERSESESKVIKVKGRLKLVHRFRWIADYPDLLECLNGI
jgi:hypothetical protein